MNNSALPLSLKEATKRGWNELDVVLVTGDSYVDHPSFGVSVIGRHLESIGLRVGIIASPDISNPDDFKKLGRPKLFFGVTAGNLDSMIMSRTALNKRRSDDAYVEGGKAGLRPERATIKYCNMIRQVYKDADIVIGGLEASLRRFAHYDFWSDKVRRSILPDSKADLLVYGMAEKPLTEVVKALLSGVRLKDIRDVRGTAVMITVDARKGIGAKAKTIPTFEEVSSDKKKFARASKMIHLNQNPACAEAFVQKHGSRYLLVNKPLLPLTTKELDAIYDLPYTRAPHPVYKKKIPAFEMIRFSITAMRGCFGGCSFCALTVHQGRAIQSRSEKSIINEVKKVVEMEKFTGYISDIGGPTANMYKMECSEPAVEAVCRKVSCVHPKICERLNTDHAPQLNVLRKARKVDGVKKVFISSGVRYDLANLSDEYIRELAKHHVSGQLKVAPEHSDQKVLSLMRKPSIESYDKFLDSFMVATRRAGLEQYVVPYFISAHPGCSLNEEVNLAEYLKRNGIRPRQIQDFIAAPMTLAADMYYTGIDPITGDVAKTDKGAHDRRLHRALIQYFKPENRRDVTEALSRAGRENVFYSRLDKEKNQRNKHKR